jgi:hypothetical protein
LATRLKKTETGDVMSEYLGRKLGLWGGLLCLGLIALSVAPWHVDASEKKQKKQYDRHVALGISLGRAYGLLGGQIRARPFSHLVLEYGIGVRPYTIELSGCKDIDISESGAGYMMDGRLKLDFMRLASRHHLGLEAGYGFARDDGPFFAGGLEYEVFLSRAVSFVVVLGVLYWTMHDKYTEMFFEDRIGANYDEVMDCYGNSDLNTYSRDVNILWGFALNFYLF